MRGIRTVALSPDVVAVLKEQRSSLRATEDDDPMFPSTTGTVLNPRNFERAFKAVIVLAGVRPVRLHDVRHLHVSLLVGHGLDIQAIADLVGHADASFTLRAYAHAFEDRRRSTAVPLGELLA